MAAQCVTKVELTVSCENLIDSDFGSKSDPLCVLLTCNSDSQWYEVSNMSSINCFDLKFRLSMLNIATFSYSAGEKKAFMMQYTPLLL